ncbi:hypothetical protein [Bacillus sp. Brlt_9]|uniref:hypothetical protein n=1 Tax=Bacillus sp. Brlt_9 TaxID=3110916 RepID=UPI003F7C03F4
MFGLYLKGTLMEKFIEKGEADAAAVFATEETGILHMVKPLTTENNNGGMALEEYIDYRNAGMQMKEIQKEGNMSENTALTLELGYRCSIKDIPLKSMLNLADNIVTMSPSDLNTTKPFKLN